MATQQDQQKYSSKLANTNILITGGTSGLGYGLAEALLEQSPPPANIILSSSNPQRVNKAIQNLKTTYPNASSKTKLTGLACNLSDEDNLESNIKSLFESLPLSPGEKLNHIIHTAGDPLATYPLSDITIPVIRKAGMVRFFAPLFIAKHAAPHLAPVPESSITITGGSVADHPVPNWTIVSSYASGLQGMVRGLAFDLKPVRVNLIQPGGVDTELWEAMGVSGERKEGMMKAMGEKSATGRVGRVHDVVEGYLCCLRDANLTAKTIGSDGGQGLV